MKNMWRDDIPRGTSPWKLLLFVTRPHRTVAMWACVLVILGGIMSVITVYMFKLITDSAHALAGGGGTSSLWYAAFAYIIVSLLGIFFWRGSGFVGMHWSVGVRATTRYALSSYVIRHSHAYFTDRFAGSISSKITQAANSMKNIVEAIMWDFTPFFVSIIGSFILA